MATIVGIDDAGRGPVIGPLVIAGVMVDEKDEEKLKSIGAKDSKMLSPLQRERLYDTIVEIAKKYKAIIISPQQVDNAVAEHKLNYLEADASIEIINEFKPDTAILDCPSNNTKAFNAYVEERAKGPKIISEHKADATYPVVSAASIIAKVTRDREIEKLKRKFRVNFGSGYPSDPRTVEFLKRNYENKKYEGIFRKSWASYKNLAEGKQKKIGEF